MSMIFSNYMYGSCRISGPTGAIFFLGNGSRILGSTKVSTGVFDLDLQPGADEGEHVVTVGVISSTPAAYGTSYRFLSDNVLRVTITVGGAPYDGDFSVEVNRVRSGPLVAPPPAPPPPPLSMFGPSFVLDPAFPIAGSDTVQVGGQLTDAAGNPILMAVLLQFAVFQDIGASTPALTATLDVAAEGTIHMGGGTNALIVETDANGRFSCTLTDLFDETVFIATANSFGGPSLFHSVLSVTFIP